jgi:hypothetical protein
MRPSLLFLAAASLSLSGCSQEGDDSAAPKPKESAAPALVGPADLENTRLEAIRQNCLKRPAAAMGEAALPTVDGLYQVIPRDKTFSSQWWLSNTRTALLSEPREGAAVTATLPPRSWVQVVEDIAFVVPKRGVVLETGQGFDLKVCDAVYEIDRQDGEGASTTWVWRQGRVFTLDQNDGHADAEALRAPYIEWEFNPDAPPLAPAAAARLGPWVRLTAPGGAAGWARGGSSDFDCFWENDRYLNDKPTVCAKYPGAAQ